jgi:hypothetical protein
MKIKFISFLSIAVILAVGFISPEINHNQQTHIYDMNKEQDSVLRHVVLFKFKEGTSTSDIKKVETAFAELPSKIPQIISYEWGFNNSPVGLEKGFTHCFLLTFKNEEDRSVYLPHPDHKAFGKVLGPYLDDVLVIDYWTN